MPAQFRSHFGGGSAMHIPLRGQMRFPDWSGMDRRVWVAEGTSCIAIGRAKALCTEEGFHGPSFSVLTIQRIHDAVRWLVLSGSQFEDAGNCAESGSCREENALRKKVKER